MSVIAVEGLTAPRDHAGGGLAQRVQALAAQVATFGPRSVPTDLRRAHLLAVATILFTERGFDGTSLTDVAAAAGVTKPVVYDAFGSKEDLFGVVVEAAHQQLLDGLSAALDADHPRGPVFASSHAYFSFVHDRRDAWRHLLGSGPALVGEGTDRLERRHAEVLDARMGEQLAAAGLTADPQDLEGLAEMLVGAIVAMAGWWVARTAVQGQPLDVGDAADRFTRLMTPSIPAVASPAAP